MSKKNSITYLKHISLIITFVIFSCGSFAEAAVLSDGMSASAVMGSGVSGSNFTTVTTATTSVDMSWVTDIAIDETSHYLFTVEAFSAGDGNNRVLVWHLDGNNTLLDYTADYVLGQEDFVSKAQVLGQDSFLEPSAIAVDETNKRIFVSDADGHRVMIFDYSSGFTDGMDASYVLGQDDFVSNTTALTQDGVDAPFALSYDSEGERLFVADSYGERITVFELSGGITNGMNASYVLGKEDFVTGGSTFGDDGVSGVRAMVYDESTDRLFASDEYLNRVLVWNLSGGITNGMSASFVLGQPDFDTVDPRGTTVASTNYVFGLDIDAVNNRLFVSNLSESRVLVFDVATIINGENAVHVLGQSDFVSNLQYAGGVGPDDSSFFYSSGLLYSSDSETLYVSDMMSNRVLIFDLSAGAPAEEPSSRGYTHPPLCTATTTPSTITKGEQATLSWDIQWPTNRRSTFYMKVPKEGLFTSNVQSITISPEHTTTYRLATFNLFGANFCESTITVQDEQGTELTTPTPLLSASASSSPFVKALLSFLSSLFGR